MTLLNVQIKKGFTLVEVLVVIAIIAIVLMVTLVSYRVGNQRLALKRAVHKLSQDIRKAQEMAMSTREFQGSIPQGGYGLILSTVAQSGLDFPHLYIISTYGSDNNPDTETERITLEKGIKVNKIYSISSSTETEVSDIFFNFIPPMPRTCILGCTADGVKIILSLEQDPSMTKTVKINKAGLIEIIE